MDSECLFQCLPFKLRKVAEEPGFCVLKYTQIETINFINGYESYLADMPTIINRNVYLRNLVILKKII